MGLDDVHAAALMGNILREASDSLDPGQNTERLQFYKRFKDNPEYAEEAKNYKDMDWRTIDGKVVYTEEQLDAMSLEDAKKAVKGLIPSKGGIGIFQLTNGKFDSTTGRWVATENGDKKANYLNWCLDNKKDWSDLKTQLEYENKVLSENPSLKSKFLSIQDTGQAAAYFCDAYEHPGDNSESIRANNARFFLSKIKEQKPVPQPSEKTSQKTVTIARRFVGNAYTWGGDNLYGTVGGKGGNGIDCSHFVQEVLNQQGIPVNYATTDNMINDYSKEGFTNIGTDFSKARAGDIAVYEGHTGIIDENGKLIEAQSSDTGITDYRMASEHDNPIGILRYTG